MREVVCSILTILIVVYLIAATGNADSHFKKPKRWCCFCWMSGWNSKAPQIVVLLALCGVLVGCSTANKLSTSYDTHYYYRRSGMLCGYVGQDNGHWVGWHYDGMDAVPLTQFYSREDAERAVEVRCNDGGYFFIHVKIKEKP